MTILTSAVEVLGENGAIAQVVDGFAVREEQLIMAESVEEAVRSASILVIEAGTGTGKTFAYLVPAMLSGQKTLISTGTKGLQDQLFHRDIPVVKKALKLSVQTALLKGRANYLCLYRLEVNMSDGRFQSRQAVHDMQEVAAWAPSTKDGDVTSIDTVTEDSAVWPLVTSTVDNCLGQDCPMYDECWLMRARKKAQEADVIVVNHHLLFADIALKEEGLGEVLPEATSFILDEAHQLPEVASQFFGTSMSSRQIIELGRDVVNEVLQNASDERSLAVTAEALEKSVLDMRLAFGDIPRKAPWAEVKSLPKLKQEVSELTSNLESLVSQLQDADSRSKGLENCTRRAEELLGKLHSVVGNSPEGQIHWFETYKKSFVIQLTPLSIAEQFEAHLNAKSSSWVFTSATLAIGSDFGFFSDRLGLKKATSQCLDSPFDYANQALFYVPRGLPDTQDREYTQAVIDAALPVLNASKGRAFFLFTSHRALQYAAEVLAEVSDFNLLVQGTASKVLLLDRFRESENAVLLGTGSFWEGVDVRGESLSCVIIDKLPFAAPNEPVVQARIDALKRQGKNPFFDYQLPNAVIALKQGAGRLIRDVTDVGVLMVCDPRLVAKPYGKTFLQSLPSMRRTRHLHEVEQFFERYST